jgi:hypothetical protein
MNICCRRRIDPRRELILCAFRGRKNSSPEETSRGIEEEVKF